MRLILSSLLSKLKAEIHDAFNGEDRRFATAQTLYILSVSFAWYLHDVARWLLFLSALYIINKNQRRADVMRCWQGMTKVTGYCFIAFGVWITIIPLIFGQEPFFAGLRSIERLLETALWIWGAMVFAKDDNFFKKMLLFSTWSCVIGATTYCVQRTIQSFAIIYDNWWFGGNSVKTGIQLVFLLPWLIYSLVHSRRNTTMLIFLCATIEVVFVVVFTYYTTIWAALLIQIICIPIVIKFVKPKANNNCRFLIYVFIVMVVIIAAIMHEYPLIKSRLYMEYEQIMAFNSDINKFTTKRMNVWLEIIDLAKMHPVTGYGYIDLANITKAQLHPHSSYFEALFYTGYIGLGLFFSSLSLFFISLFIKVQKHHGYTLILFVVQLMLISYITASISEVFFYTGREVAIIFWVPVSLLLLPNADKFEIGHL